MLANSTTSQIDWSRVTDEQKRAFAEDFVRAGEQLANEEPHPPCPLEPFHYTPCACLDPSVLPPGCQNACSAIHHYFSLSYANYMVLRRSLLQSMSPAWQAKFVALLMELDDATDDLDDPVCEYKVIPRGEDGKRIEDPFWDYDRGRRKVPLKTKETG